MWELLDEFIREEVRPAAKQIDRTGEFRPELCRRAAEIGLQALLHDEAEGLVVARTDAARETTERIATCSPAVALSIAGSRLTAYLLAKYAPAHLRQRWLEATLRAQAFGSFAITEPGAGSDVRGLSTVAVPEAEGFRLTGTKCWVGFAPVARYAIVLAKIGHTGRDAPMHAFVVDMSSEGAEGTSGPGLSGFRGMPNGVLRFEQVWVPGEDRLKVDGFLGMMDGLNLARIEAAAYACGLLKGALLASVDRANSRRAFDAPLAELAIIQRKVGRMVSDYAAAHELTRRAAESFANGIGGDLDLISMAKMFASDAARRHTDEAMQIFGAQGIAEDEDVNRMHRDAKVTQIFDGTSEIHETMLGRRTLRRSSRGQAVVDFLGGTPSLMDSKEP